MKTSIPMRGAVGALLALLAGSALAHPGHDGAASVAHLWPLMAVLAVAALALTGAGTRGGARFRARLPGVVFGAALAAVALLALSHL